MRSLPCKPPESRSDVSDAAIAPPARRGAAGRPRAAAMAVFFVGGPQFAPWSTHIPQGTADLHLTDGSLGLALLGAPLGAVSAMLVSAPLLPRLGSRRMVQAALLGYCLAGPFVGVVGSRMPLTPS